MYTWQNTWSNCILTCEPVVFINDDDEVVKLKQLFSSSGNQDGTKRNKNWDQNWKYETSPWEEAKTKLK